MTPLARRVISLDGARHPRGSYLVDGVLMDLPAALSFFRRRHIKEADRKRHSGRTVGMLENQGGGR